MPTYSFDCREHGPHDVVLAMASVTGSHPCPACGAPSRRVFTPPRLNLGDSRARALIDATKATADAPPVVTSIPGQPRRRQRVTHDPRFQRLPKAD